jgi:hypothetical protein
MAADGALLTCALARLASSDGRSSTARKSGARWCTYDATRRESEGIDAPSMAASRRTSRIWWRMSPSLRHSSGGRRLLISLAVRFGRIGECAAMIAFTAAYTGCSGALMACPVERNRMRQGKPALRPHHQAGAVWTGLPRADNRDQLHEETGQKDQ